MPIFGATGSTTSAGCGDSFNPDGTYTFADGAIGTSTNVDSTPEVRRFTYETKRCTKATKAYQKAKKVKRNRCR